MKRSDPSVGALAVSSWDGRVELARMALEEARRYHAGQRSEIIEIRARVLSLLAFVGSAMAFLVGAIIQKAPHSLAFRSVAFFGTAVLGLTFTLAVKLLSPVKGWSDSDPEAMNTYAKDGDVFKDPAEFYQEMTSNFVGYASDNDELLKAKIVQLRNFVISLGLSLIVWVAVAWWFI